MKKIHYRTSFLWSTLLALSSEGAISTAIAAPYPLKKPLVASRTSFRKTVAPLRKKAHLGTSWFCPSQSRRMTYCARPNSSYCVKGLRYYPQPYYELVQTGVASHYGMRPIEKKTTTGELYCHWKMTAAHKTLPLPCVILVENLGNGKAVKVKVNDRGPFCRNRIIDLSASAAKALGFYSKGITKVRIRTLIKETLALPENRTLIRRCKKIALHPSKKDSSASSSSKISSGFLKAAKEASDRMAGKHISFLWPSARQLARLYLFPFISQERLPAPFCNVLSNL